MSLKKETGVAGWTIITALAIAILVTMNLGQDYHQEVRIIELETRLAQEETITHQLGVLVLGTERQLYD